MRVIITIDIDDTAFDTLRNAEYLHDMSLSAPPTKMEFAKRVRQAIFGVLGRAIISHGMEIS